MADDKIRVNLPDGRVATFPAGTRPEVIQATVQSLVGASGPSGAPTPSGGGTESPVRPPGPAATAPATGRPEGAPGPGALADSFVGRMVRAPIVNRVDPLAEMAVRGGNAVAPGVVSDDMLRQVQAQNTQRKAEYEASRQRAGDDGFDAAGTIGTGVADMALLGRIGAPKSLLGMGGYGAIGGGLSGLMTPVEGSEDMGGLQYLGALGRQGMIGAAAGMVAAPAAAVGLEKLATGAKWVGREVGDVARRFFKPTQEQQLVGDARKLEMFLFDQAKEAGVDWAAVPNAVKESLREASRRATKTTGQLPVDAVKNRLIAEAENLPRLTLGQTTRDPMQYSREANSPEPELRALFGQQRNAATERLHSVANRFGRERSDYELGNEVGDEVARQAQARRNSVSAAYDAFTGDAGGYHRIANTPDFVKSALTELKVSQSFDDLPTTFRDQLLELEKAGGRLSIRDAAQMWKNINKRYSSTYGTPEGNALGTVKEHLRDLLDNAKFSNTDKGDAVIAQFQAANKARRDMGAWEESSRGIAEFAKKNPQVAAERVFDRYFMSGAIDDTIGLWKTLPGHIREDVKRAFVDRVAKTALNDYKSIATKAGGANKMLDNFPKEKLDLMFKPEELKSLRNTIEYLRLTSEAPPGNFVNHSNSLVDLKDALSRTSNVPLLGAGVSRPARMLMEEAATRRATDGGLAVRPELTSPDFVRGVQRKMTYLPGSFGAGVVGATPSEQEEQ